MAKPTSAIGKSIAIRSLLPLAIIGISACFSGSAKAAGTIFYYFDKSGAGGTIRLLSVDPLRSSTSTVVANTGITANTSPNAFSLNGFAFDPTSNGVYFMAGSDGGARDLYFTSLTTGSTTSLGNFGIGGLGLCPTGAITCTSSGNANFNNAAYYDGKYYSMLSSTNNLFSIEIPKTGSTPNPINFNTANYSTLTLTGVPTGAYGDIAFDASGNLYGVQQSGVTWKYTFSSSSGSGATLPTACSGNECNLQIGFNSDKTILYGVNSSSGEWYTINTISGARTPTGFTTTLAGQALFDLTDTANVPGPLPILGAAAAFRVSRKIRTRIQSSAEA